MIAMKLLGLMISSRDTKLQNEHSPTSSSPSPRVTLANPSQATKAQYLIALMLGLGMTISPINVQLQNVHRSISNLLQLLVENHDPLLTAHPEC
jgi:hypothetical protein